jgi:uncharacterized protein
MESDEAMRRILSQARVVAIVGASPKPDRPSHMVMRYLQEKGYRVVPVNPRHAGEKILGETVAPDLASIADPVDAVDVFRRSEAAGAVVDEAIRIGAKAVWMQLGVRDDAAAARATAAGVDVVMDRCIKIERERLFV